MRSKTGQDSFVSSLTRTDGVLVRKPRGPATVRTTGLLGSIAAISTWPLRASGGATGRRLLRGAATLSPGVTIESRKLITLSQSALCDLCANPPGGHRY